MTFMKLIGFAMAAIVARSGFAEVKQVNPCHDVPDSVATFEKSTFKGCKLQKVKADSIYDRLGLKAGDIVHPPDGTSNMELKNRSRTTHKIPSH